MDQRDALQARLRAFYWPPSAPLRRLATINAGLWGVVFLVSLSQHDTSSIAGLLYGALLATITWALIRLCVYDAGGRLAPRLPFQWRHARGGRSLFAIQGLITLYVALHDLQTWTAQPTLQDAASDLLAGVFILGFIWGAPAVAMAVYHQTGATIQGQNQPPPLDQTTRDPFTPRAPWQGQDIPQDPMWDKTAQQQDPSQDVEWEPWEPNAPQDTPPPSTPPGAPLHDEAWAYGVLHVHPTATRKHIDNAFRAFVAVWHPDTAQNPEELAEKEAHMRELNEAIAILRKVKPDIP